MRPSLAVPDDPQTDEAARSLSQCATRESILAGAVLGLAGPGKKISGIMPCTVIRNGDTADNILNREIHPEWNGERTKLVYQFPSNEALWRRYAELRADGLRRGAMRPNSTAAVPVTESATTGECLVLKAAVQSATFCSTPTPGSRSSTRAWPRPLATSVH